MTASAKCAACKVDARMLAPALGFAFLVPIGGEDVSVYMPGCPLEVLTTETFGKPHLYLDGSSLWFNVAIECLRDRVGEEIGHG